MHYLIFTISLTFFALGLVFVYQPTWIVRFNKIARERIFNDAIVLLERRKKGVFFLLLGFIFFYWGYYSAQYSPGNLTEKLVSTDRLLYQSLRDLHSRQYENSKMLCELVLAREPDNADALYQLGAAQILMNDPAAGEKSWSKAELAAPHSPKGQHLKALVLRLKDSAPNASVPAAPAPAKSGTQ